jgi:hypothetical protein
MELLIVNYNIMELLIVNCNCKDECKVLLIVNLEASYMFFLDLVY